MRSITLVIFGFCWITACNTANRASGPGDGTTAPAADSQSVPVASRAASSTAKPRAAPIAYVRFEDPAEHAFSIDTPQGWNVKGGLFRLGYFDARPMVELTSPDGRITVRVNDYGVPPYSLPDRFHPKEGSSYTLEAQAQITVARYRSGPEFALLYTQARFKGACSQLEIRQDAPALPVKFNLPPQTAVTQESEGQVAFKCASEQTSPDQRNMNGFAYAKTRLSSGQGTPIWNVPALLSFLTPADRSAEAESIALHVAQSYQISPQWIAYQAEMDRKGLEFAQALARNKMLALSQQVQQFRARMQAMSNQAAGFERRMNEQAHQVEGFTDALNGITRTYDPLTGENRQVWTGQSGQYWVNGLGQVISSPNAPAGFRPLDVVH